MKLTSSDPRHDEIRTEISFFLVYFLLFPIVSSLEYNFNERGSATLFLADIPDRLVYGTLNMLPYWLYYHVLIRKVLFKNRLLAFAALIILFLVALNFYYVFNYWLIAHLPFLPHAMVASAARWFEADVLLHFSIVYIFRDLLVITALAYYLRAGRLAGQVEALRSRQLEVELNSLKVQLQPHFFFNTLNNIYSLALQRSEQTAPLIAGHTEIMRYVLYDAALPTVKLLKEVAFLKSFTDVEAIRFSEHISITFEMQGISDTPVIEPLLLLPFVENAFKHGVRDEIGQGYVHIVICCFENELVVEVKNSKPSAGAVTDGTGLGLDNAIKRLAILYPGTHQIHVTDEADRYEVQLNLKLRSE